jgi:pyruvate carboxylase subunit B
VRYTVECGGESFEVELEHDTGSVAGDGWRVRVGHEDREVHYWPRGRDGATIAVDGRVTAVDFRQTNGAFTAHTGAADLTVRVLSERDRLAEELFGGTAASGAGGGEVRAVMPGVVRKLLVSLGDTVEAGTPLLLIEAMKMENEVRAESGGVVTAIQIAPDDAVEAGQLLLELAPKPTDEAP